MNKTYLLVFASGILFAAFFSSFSSAGGKIQMRYTTASHVFSDTSFPFFKAKDHKGKSVISKSGIITFTSGLDNDFYQVDSNNKYVYLYMELKLERLLNPPVIRTPLNISIVVDRSGSMQGIKMGYAKKAAKAIIDQLQPTDYVSIVMYDNAVDSVQVPTAVSDKETIKSKVDKITPRGATNLWGGTEKGYDFVRRNYKTGYINRVLLISDGLANAGLTDSLQIRKLVQKYKDESGVTISTFGVGLDYNEQLMTDMAETGAGNYYFIDAPDNMIQLFDKELNGMLNVVAQNAVLKIQMPKGVKIDKSYPWKYSEVDNTVMIRLLDLFAEETKGNVFRFRIEDGVKSALKFTTTFSYTDIFDKKEKTLTNENLLMPVKSVDDYLTHFNKPVVEQTILYTTNENLEKAMLLADKGYYEQATKDIDANTNYLKGYLNYVKNSSELTQMDSTLRRYRMALVSARTQTIDSVKKLQKSSKEESYKMRNKKQ
jgi:Ca-activated chloride channel homolog